MRILALDFGPEWRGGQGQTLLVSAALARRGNDVCVAARGGSPLARAVAARVDVRLPVHEVPRGSEAAPALLLDLARAVKSFRPDVLWAGDSRSHGAAVWSRATRRLPLAVHRRVVFTPATNPISRVKYAAVDRFFAVSSAVEESLQSAGIEPEKIVLLPDGLPPEAFVSAPAPAAPPYRIAHVGSFDGRKGQEVVVEVVARLAREGWDLEAVFLGDGPERAHVEERARQANVASRCVFAGVVSDVPAHLSASHLLLLPSQSEGASLALLEAMAAGCPVVTHEVGGAREVVDGGQAGKLLPTLDPESWAEATRELLSNGEERRRLVEAGRRFVAPRTLERTAAALEGEFQALVAATDQ